MNSKKQEYSKPQISELSQHLTSAAGTKGMDASESNGMDGNNNMGVS